MYGPMHGPNLHGAGEATRRECGRGVGKLNVGANLEDVTAAEFCEEGGHGSVPAKLRPEFGSQCRKFRFLQSRIVEHVGHRKKSRGGNYAGVLDKPH